MVEKKYRDAVFVVTEARSCPIYDAEDELKVQNFSLIASNYKSSCLHLTQKLSELVTVKKNGYTSSQSQTGTQSQFDCGGCDEGKITFEHKKEKDFATLQMKMLKEAQDKRNSKQLRQHFDELRTLDIFKPLNDSSLIDLALLLEFKTIPKNKRIVKRGAPGNKLYIILEGAVSVINKDNSKVAELHTGEIFGEMSLLSGEPVSNSINTIEDTKVATLSVKHFRDILRGYHILQLFLLKLLVDRSQRVALRTGNITSGMGGKLSDVSVKNLFEILDVGRKTGGIRFSLKNGKAVVFFREGEIVYARYEQLRQKEAVAALLEVESGHFHYTRGVPKELDNAPAIW